MSTPSLKDSLKIDTPRRTPNHKTKSHVVKINDNGTERMIRFGQQGVSGDKEPTSRQSSFKARHKKNIDKGKTSAAYWANKVKWAEGGSVGYDSDRIDAMAEEILNFAEGGYVGGDEYGVAPKGSLIARASTEVPVSDTDSKSVTEEEVKNLANTLTQIGVDMSPAGTYEAIKNLPQNVKDSVSEYDKGNIGKATLLMVLGTAGAIPGMPSNVIGKAVKGTPVKGKIKVPATPKSKNIEPKPTEKVSKKVKELRNRWVNADGSFTKEASEEANRRAGKKIETTEQVPLSKFLEDNVDLKGGEKVKLIATQSDRTATSKGGGPGFSKVGEELSKMADEIGLKISKKGTIEPKEALEILEDPLGHPVWGVFDKGTASSLINRNIREESLGTNVIWTTLLGTDLQHMSNPKVFEELLTNFKKAVIDGKLPDAQAAKMNHNLKLLGFPEGADVRDPQLWDLVDGVGTFVQRKNMAKMIRGDTLSLDQETKDLIKLGKLPTALPMGGVKSRIIDVDEILNRTTEPGLSLEAIGPKAGTIGNYGMVFDNNSYLAPSIHEGFPTIVTGKSLPGAFNTTPIEDVFPEFMGTQKTKFDLRSLVAPKRKGGFDRSFYGMSGLMGQSPAKNFNLDLTKKPGRELLEELKNDPKRLEEAIRLQDEFNRGVDASGRGLLSQNITQMYVDELKKKGMNKGGTFDEFEDEENEEGSLIVSEEMNRIFSDTSANTEEIEIQEIETSEESPSIIRDFITGIKFTGGKTNVKYGTDKEKVMMWDGENLTPKTITTDMLMGATQGGLTTTVGDNVVVDVSGGLKGFSDFNDTTIEGTPITGGLTYIGDGDNRLRFETEVDPNERELINSNLSGSYNMGDNRLSGNINYDHASGNITNIVGKLQRMLNENSTGYGKVKYDPINEKTSGKVGYEYRVPNTGSIINVEGSVDPYRDNETKAMLTFKRGFNRGGSYDADKINMMADQILETYDV